MKSGRVIHKNLLVAVSACVAIAAGLTAMPASGTTYYTNAVEGTGTNWYLANLWSLNSTGSGGSYQLLGLSGGTTGTEAGLNADPNDFVVVSTGTTGLIRNYAVTSGPTYFSGHSLTLSPSAEIRFKGVTPSYIDFGGMNDPTGGLILNGGYIDTGDNATDVLHGRITLTANSSFTYQTSAGSAGRVFKLEGLLVGPYTLSAMDATSAYPLWIGGAVAPSNYNFVANPTAGTLSLKAGAAYNQPFAFEAGTNLDFNLGSPTASDVLSVTGTALLLSGSYNLNINALSGFGVGQYPILSASTLTETGAVTWNVASNGPSYYSYAVSYSGNNVVLTVNAAGLFWSGSASNLWNTSDQNWGGMTYSNTWSAVFPANALNTSISISPSAVSPPNVLFVNGATPYTFSGAAISGPGSVTLSVSAGLVTFNNANTYSGATSISGGTLQLGNANALLNSTAAVNVANGLAFSPGIGTFNVGGLSGSGSFPLSNTGGGAITLQVGGDGASTQFTGSLGGNGNLTKAGSGALIFTASQAYSGTTTISGGTLQLGNGGNTGSLLPGGTIVNNGALVFSRSGTVTQGIDFSGSAISGTGSLTQAGNGTLVLNAANTFSGATTIAAGNVLLADPNGNALQNSTVFLNSGSNSLAFASGIINNSFSLGGLSGSGNLALADMASAPVFLSVGGNGASTSYSGILSGNSGASLTKIGSGMLTLSASNLYNGPTEVSAGTLSVTSDAALGDPAALYLNIDGGATFNAAGTFATNRQVTLNGPATLAVSANQTLTLVTPIAGGFALTKNGSGTLRLGASSGLPGGDLNIVNGMLDLGGLSQSAGSVAFSGGTLANGSLTGTAYVLNGPASVSANLHGSSLAVNAGGNAVLSGTNAISGTTTVNSGGALRLAGPQSLAGSAVSLAGGTLSINTVPVPPGLYGNTVNMSASSTLDIQGTQLADMGALTIATTGQALNVTSQSAGALRFPSLALANSAGSYSVNIGGGELVFALLSDRGKAATISKSGLGYLTLTGANTLNTGTNFQVTGGTLAVLGQNLNSGPLAGAPVTLNNGALLLSATSAAGLTFDVTAGNALTLAGGNNTIAAGNGTSQGLVQATPAAVSGGTVNLSGSSLSIPFASTLNLAAVSGYTLAVNPALTLANSGTLSGGPGNVTLQPANLAVSPGTLSAANGGTLTVAGLMNTGYFAPAATGTVLLSGTYAGPLANLAPASGGALAINYNATPGTLNIAGGAYLAASSSSFGLTALSLNGGALGATTPLTGSNAVGNSLLWGVNPTLNFGGPSILQLSATLGLAGSGTTYNLNDPGGRGVLSGAISGPGALAISGSPTITAANTYGGGTTFNSNANAAINNNQALASGPLVFNNGGLSASVALTGSNALGNSYTWTSGQGMYVNAGQNIEFSGPGTIALGSTGNIDIAGNVTAILSGNLSGSGILHKQTMSSNTAGNLVLAGTNSSFTGTLFLDQNSGPTCFGNNLALGASGSLILGNGGIDLFAGTAIAGANVVLPNSVTVNGGFGVDSGNGGNLSFSGKVALAGTGTTATIYSLGAGTKAVTFSGVISGAQGLTLSGSNGNGNNQPVLLNNSNTYSGVTSVVFGTLVAGTNVPASGNKGAFGLTPSAILVGDTTAGQGGSYMEGAALLAANGSTIGRAITVLAGNPGVATLGGYDNTNVAFGTGAIVLNKPVTLVSQSSGTNSVAFNAIISDASGTNAVTVAGPGNIVFSRANTYGGATNITGGTLSLVSAGAINGNGAVTVAAGAALGGVGSVAGATTLNGSLAPSSSGTLSISNKLTINNGATLVLSASGGKVGVASVGSLTYGASSAVVTLLPAPLDNTTLSGGSCTFLAWSGTSSVTAGVQSNWTINAANQVSWSGASSPATVLWDTPGNWNGVTVSGGTVNAVYNSGTTGPGHLEVDGLTAVAGPIALSNVLISSSAGATVTGPAAAASVQSLTLGSGAGGVNTFNLGSGSLSVTGAAGTIVNTTGLLNVGSGSLQTTALQISGTASLGAGGSLAAYAAAAVNAPGALNVGSGTLRREPNLKSRLK